MDASSRGAVRFLEILQDAHAEMREVSIYYSRLGVRLERPFLGMSARPNRKILECRGQDYGGSLDLVLTGCDTERRAYELLVDVLWDANQWSIEAELWVDADEGGQTLLRELPVGYAQDLETLREVLLNRIQALRTFEDLVLPALKPPAR